MFSVEVHDKRILAARIESCDTIDEAKELAAAVVGGLKSVDGDVVGTADFRRARIFTPPVTEVFVQILRNDNPRIERSGHLLGPGAAFTLQIERIVREAGNPQRRTFQVTDEAEKWLGELLSPSQRAWLRAWYDAGKP